MAPVDKKELLKNKKVVFQVLDYTDVNIDYEGGKEFVINLFGVNKKGNSVCVIVDGFNPFFYIKAPDGIRGVSEFLASMKVHFDKTSDKGRFWAASKSIIQEECETVMKKNFYGYQRKKEKFFKLSFGNSMGYHMFKKLMGETVRIRNRDVDIEVFEGNFDPVLRFFQMRNIQPSGWVEAKDFESEDGFSHCQINIRVHWESLAGIPNNDDMAPIIQASYDIECYSIDPEVFPQPEVRGNVVTQIATAFKRYGDDDFYLKHIITLKQCAPIKEKEGETPIIVESYNTEKEVLVAWSRLLIKMDPDIIYTYNGDGFDGNYLYKRAEVCKAKTELLRFGKLKDTPGKLNCTTFTSGAYGSTDFKRLVIPGRVNFDLLVYMKREFKLSSYKLDSVAETYLTQNKNPMTPRQMFEFYERGDPEEIKTLAEYCFCEGTRVSLQNCSVDIKCLEKLDTDVVSWVENKGFSTSKKAKFFNNGVKDCLKITLLDGTEVNCTKNHRFLTDSGWVEAQNLTGDHRILSYPEPAFCDYEKECDQTFKFSELTGDLSYEHACIFSRILGYLLTDGGIYNQVCYKNYSQGRVKYNYTSSKIYCGTKIDAEALQKDIYILTGKSPFVRKTRNTFDIALPVDLTKMFLSLKGIEKGSRISSENGLPEFLKHDDTPIWVVREFLKGLMGGDGCTPCLSSNKFSGVAFVQSKNIEQSEALGKYMTDLQNLFGKFDINTIISNSRKNGMGDGHTRVLKIMQDDLIKYYEKIGFAYCASKMYKLGSVASYYKFRNEVTRQNKQVSIRVKNLNSQGLSRKHAIEQAHAELKENEFIFNNHYSLPGTESISWYKDSEKSNFSHKYFPSPVEYLKTIGAYDKFVSDDNKHSYAVKQYDEYTPCYYLTIIGKKDIGEQPVYDIEVEDTHNFVANGVVVHNCIQDTLLPQRLIDKLNVLINQVEMSKITLVPIKFLWERGQQIKVFSQIIQRTTEKGYLIPTKKYGYVPPEEEKFQGATVLEPATGAYFDPVVTLDFQSLYPSIIRAHNFCYSTIVLDKDNLRGDEEIEDIKWEAGDDKYHYKYVQNREISVLPELLSDLFTARVAVRAKMKSITDPFVLSVMDKKQLAIKVSMNSVYGFLAAHMIKCKPIAASVTAVGRQMIEKTKNYIEDNYNASTIVYGDSVAKDTPILLRNPDTGEVLIKAIETFGNGWVEYPGFKVGDNTIRNEKQMASTKFEVWTDLGWSKIKKVIKHKTTKRMFRVISNTGCVDVTEDHSLCTPDLKKIKPGKVSLGQDLLHSFPESFSETCDTVVEAEAEDWGFFLGGRNLVKKGDMIFNDIYGNKIVPNKILNSPRNIRMAYWRGFYKSGGGRIYGRSLELPNFLIKGKEASQGMYYLLRSLGHNICINNFNRNGMDDFYSIKHTEFESRPETCVKKIFELPSSDINGDYVYDIETNVGRFQAGIGQMIVSNTDSVFCTFNLDHVPEEKQMEESFRLGKEAADACTNNLFKKPIKLEFEKVFNPLLLFGKKMYIGQLFGTTPDKPDYIDKKGVVSKRRDNTPLTRRVYDETVKIIMDHGKEGVGKAIEHVKYEVQNLLLDKTDIKELTISKTLRSNYKSGNLPHVAVAKKMTERDPGSAPKSNDRVDYVFIENESKKQFEKAEDPEYVKNKKIKLDSLYYVEHQLQNPLCQVLGLVMDDPKDFFKDITSGYRITQKRRLLFAKQDREGQPRISDFFKKKMVILESDEE